MEDFCENINKRKEDELVLLKQLHTRYWYNGTVPEPPPQTKRKVDHAAMNVKSFGVQNNA